MMATTHLFVDTNVFLEFYSYPKETLEQVQSLTKRLHENGITLHLPQQVLNEIERNREARLKASADTFKQTSHPAKVPEHMSDYPEIADYKGAVAKATTLRNVMVNRASADAGNKSLTADKALAELFEKAKKYPHDDNVFAQALRRSQQGNPPGKPESVGDQYNWEMLLAHAPNEDLHIVSNDGDYLSTLNPSLPHPFLAKEWNELKGSALHVYGSIKPFLDRYLTALEEADKIILAEEVKVVLNPKLEDAKVQIAGTVVEPEPAASPDAGTVTAADPKKEAAIEMLVDSGSFATTHAAIAELEKFQAALSRSEVERLLKAVIENNQINWIASDSDVYAFYTTLLVDHLNDVEPGLHEAAAEIFALMDDGEPR